MLQHSDDATIHRAGVEPNWRESFYCNFFDTESRYYGVAWQGVRPNSRVAEAVFMLFDGPTKLIHSVSTTLEVEPDVDRRELGAQRFELLEPWSHWKVHFEDDDAQLTVDWRQTSEVCDHDPTDTPGVDAEPAVVAAEAPEEDDGSFYGTAKHFEATGTVEVSGVIGGEAVSFSGFGTRDRAWGPRNWGALGFCWWQTLQFPDGDAAHVLLIQEETGGDMTLFGLLHRDGRSRPMTYVEGEAGYDGEPSPPVSGKQRFVDDEGRELVVSSMELLYAEPFALLPDGQNLEPREVAAEGENPYFWTFQRFVRDDGVVGHGMIDQACWKGMQHESFRSTVATGKVYAYGLESRTPQG